MSQRGGYFPAWFHAVATFLPGFQCGGYFPAWLLWAGDASCIGLACRLHFPSLCVPARLIYPSSGPSGLHTTEPTEL